MLLRPPLLSLVPLLMELDHQGHHLGRRPMPTFPMLTMDLNLAWDMKLKPDLEWRLHLLGKLILLMVLLGRSIMFSYGLIDLRWKS